MGKNARPEYWAINADSKAIGFYFFYWIVHPKCSFQGYYSILNFCLSRLLCPWSFVDKSFGKRETGQSQPVGFVSKSPGTRMIWSPSLKNCVCVCVCLYFEGEMSLGIFVFGSQYYDQVTWAKNALCLMEHGPCFLICPYTVYIASPIYKEWIQIEKCLFAS